MTLVNALIVTAIYSPARERWEIHAPHATKEDFVSVALALTNLASRPELFEREIDDDMLARALDAYRQAGRVDDAADHETAMREALAAALGVTP